MNRRIASIGLLLWLAVVTTSMAQERKDQEDKPKPPAKKAVEREPFWRAWAITQGDETELTVEGMYPEGGPGRVAIVKPAAPQGINPKILILELTTFDLPGVWPAIMHSIPAHYVQTPYKNAQYDSVVVRFPDGSSVNIAKIIDAGKGPKKALGEKAQ